MSTLRTQIANLLAQIPMDFGGGCSASKAYVMASLIRERNIHASLDIGVYRGRSLLPQALAHRRYTGGVAYGVDPWSRDEAMQADNAALKAALDRFVETTDFEAIHRDVDELRRKFAVERNCVLVRKTSAAAIAEFREMGQTFGLIHVDGNHDTAIVVQDVLDSMRLLDGEGILVMDDVSWDSVKPAYDLASSRMTRLFQRVDPANDYAVFWNVPEGDRNPPPWFGLFHEQFVRTG